MDKYEYKVRVDEIKELISEGEYAQAAEIADTIDWRRVKSVVTLCVISDLYKINRRYEDARDVLYLAYERRPGGKSICYSLCELCVKTEDFVQAVNFYKEFVQVAPKDSGRYILQYKIYEAQDVSLEERIGVLEELKKRDYREKWAYELAYLYHRVGLATKCVEECDELILWFGEGKYVIKAMELKMLHEPLTDAQKEKYDYRLEMRRKAAVAAEPAAEPVAEPVAEPATQTATQSVVEPVVEVAEVIKEEPVADEAGEFDIHVKTVDVSEYNTINLQAELAEGLKEILAQDLVSDSAQTEEGRDILPENDTESLDFPEIDEVDEDDLEPETEIINETEVFFGETDKLDPIPSEQENQTEDSESTADIVKSQMQAEWESQKTGTVVYPTEPPKEFAEVLAQESDGQIRLVVPEVGGTVEKQITGQLNIQDILAEWERMKKENEEKRREEVRQHVLEHTGEMFTKFEEAVRDGLLEQLESGADTEKSMTVVEPVTDVIEEEEDPAEEPVTDVMEEEEDPAEEPVTDVMEEEEDLAEEPIHRDRPAPTDRVKVRAWTREEEELYSPFIRNRSCKERLIRAIDNVSLAAYTGNIVITCDESEEALELAKNMVRELQITDSNFSGKVAKISGRGLNEKNVEETITQLNNGALIVEKASDMKESTVDRVHKIIQQENLGIVLVLIDTKKAISDMLDTFPQLRECFNARMDLEAMSNDMLVEAGRRYAKEMEYAIDDLGILAFHTRIEELQTSSHTVSVEEAKAIVDEAIEHANKKTPRHFVDILLGKRYDEEDMIILTERDFA